MKNKDKQFVSASCIGERCSMCDEPPVAKVSEVVMWDDPNKIRHPYTAYVCRKHFNKIFHGGRDV